MKIYSSIISDNLNKIQKFEGKDIWMKINHGGDILWVRLVAYDRQQCIVNKISRITVGFGIDRVKEKANVDCVIPTYWILRGYSLQDFLTTSELFDAIENNEKYIWRYN